MVNFKLFLPLVLFFLSLSVIPSAFAAITITLNATSQGSTYRPQVFNTSMWYDNNPFWINITATGGAADVNCSYVLDDVWANTTYMTNYTEYGWTNISAFSNFVSNGGGFHNLTFFCNDSAGAFDWYNSSASEKFIWFKINEYATNTVNVTLRKSNITSSVGYWTNWTANNGTYEFFTTSPFILYLNITGDKNMTSCTAYINNETTSVTMSNITNKTTWQNSTTWNVVNNPNGRALRNLTAKCLDAWGNVSWINGTGAMGSFWYFYVNERAPNATLITDRSGLTNASVLSSDLSVIANLSTNVTTSYCYYWVNNNGTTLTVMGNYSSMQRFWNSSVLSINDSRYNTYNNLTYSCQDVFGNKSWLNSTPEALIFWIKDTTSPSVTFKIGTNPSGIKANVTYLGNYSQWNITFNYTDANYHTCGIKIYPFGHYADSAGVFKVGSIMGTNSTDYRLKNCTVIFRTNFSDIELNLTYGEFRIQAWANDTAGNSGVGSNITAIHWNMSAGWNMIGFLGANFTHQNETMSEFAKNHGPNVTIVSKWNNSEGKWDTYSVLAPTVNNHMIINSGDMLYVYVSSNSKYISPDYSSLFLTPIVASMPSNVTIVSNTTSKNNSLSAFALAYNTSINTTLFSCNTYVDVELNGTLATQCNSTMFAFNYSSFYNATTGYLTTCKRAFTACSGTTLSPLQIVLPKGSAIWANLVTYGVTNTTVNRSAIQ